MTLTPQQLATTASEDGRATALANPNIALVKYWGKRDEALILPWTGSLSLTLDAAPTTTTVRLTDAADDVVLLGGRALEGTARSRVTRFIDLVRALADRDERVTVDSHNEIPTGAGLASSASGFAALALAASTAFGLDLDRRALSRLARRGSGSASRSIFDGIAVWHAGYDDESSFAEAVPARGLDLGMVLTVLDARAKSVSSRDGMRRTVDTSPYYPAWVERTPVELEEMLAAIARADFTAVGTIAERNAMRMHATMLGAEPPVRYWGPASVELLDLVANLRGDGLECYATMDAGPNVKILCRADAVDELATRILEAQPDIGVIPARAGRGARLITSEPGGSAGEQTTEGAR
ncbi:diphosphomevalonate decarboxylase [Plantibacter flavus]|uniref:diphosphomevalonate decarboxylase n=1 Tax=Plantibacter flavus TaxID=150123 RepID=UPI003392CCC7